MFNIIDPTCLHVDFTGFPGLRVRVRATDLGIKLVVSKAFRDSLLKQEACPLKRGNDLLITWHLPPCVVTHILAPVITHPPLDSQHRTLPIDAFARSFSP